jgi:hypothetical protein
MYEGARGRCGERAQHWARRTGQGGVGAQGRARSAPVAWSSDEHFGELRVEGEFGHHFADVGHCAVIIDGA